MRKETISGN